MRFSIVLMAAIVLFLLAGVIPAPDGGALPQLFKSPVFILMGFVLAVTNLIGVFKRWKNLGFVLMHLGVVILLIGGFIGHVKGRRGSMTVGINGPAVNLMQLQDMTQHEIPVQVESLEFKVEHYPPSYTRYVPEGDTYLPVGTFTLDPESELVEIEGIGSIAVNSFRMGSLWMPRVPMEDGSILVQKSMTPKRYETRLRFDGETEETVTINYPVTYKGWRFYLMSYDQRMMQYVVLSARYDPGRSLVVVGIWMVIVGSFVMSFWRGGRHA